MSKVVIYTMDNCTFCLRAKRLLTERGVQFEEKHLSMDDDAAWEELERKSKMMTAPQIFYGETLVGGFQELAALDEKDKLASLKSG